MKLIPVTLKILTLFMVVLAALDFVGEPRGVEVAEIRCFKNVPPRDENASSWRRLRVRR